MRRDIPTVTTGTRFEEAFRIMQECHCPAVPVLDSMKRLVGLLTPENVSELMMVQSALPRRRVVYGVEVDRPLCARRCCKLMRLRRLTNSTRHASLADRTVR